MDVSGNPRIIGTRVDMGAIEHLGGCFILTECDDRIYGVGETFSLSIKFGNYGETETVDVIAALRMPDSSFIFLAAPKNLCNEEVS